MVRPLGCTQGDTEELLFLHPPVQRALSTKLEGHLPNTFPNQLPFKAKLKKRCDTLNVILSRAAKLLI